MTGQLALRVQSRAEEAGLSAMVDIAAVTAELSVEHRIVGGQMVRLHVAAAGAEEPRRRETADADMGISSLTASSSGEALVTALRARGYDNPSAANRFERTDERDRQLAIDLLAPAPSRALRSNRVHGGLVLDEVPGLMLALSSGGLPLDLSATMLDGSELRVNATIPDLRSALCLKLLSWNSRKFASDAFDVWRLLRCARASASQLSLGGNGSQGDAGKILGRDFASPAGAGIRAATTAPAEQAELRALALTSVAR